MRGPGNSISRLPLPCIRVCPALSTIEKRLCGVSSSLSLAGGLHLFLKLLMIQHNSTVTGGGGKNHPPLKVGFIIVILGLLSGAMGATDQICRCLQPGTRPSSLFSDNWSVRSPTSTRCSLGDPGYNLHTCHLTQLFSRRWNSLGPRGYHRIVWAYVSPYLLELSSCSGSLPKTSSFGWLLPLLLCRPTAYGFSNTGTLLGGERVTCVIKLTT